MQLIAVVVALLAIVVLFKTTWRVAEPNQALIVTGFGAGGESDSGTAFKIVVGKGAAVIPGFQVARKLSLDTRSTQLEVDCVTQQGIGDPQAGRRRGLPPRHVGRGRS